MSRLDGFGMIPRELGRDFPYKSILGMEFRPPTLGDGSEFLKGIGKTFFIQIPPQKVCSVSFWGPKISQEVFGCIGI